MLAHYTNIVSFNDYYAKSHYYLFISSIIYLYLDVMYGINKLGCTRVGNVKMANKRLNVYTGRQVFCEICRIAKGRSRVIR